MRPRLDETRARVLLGILIAAYGALYSFVCITKFRYYLYTDFDLAIFAQALDGMLDGRFFNSIRGMPWLGDHASLNLFLLAPIYALFRHPNTLLVIQSAALAFGAVPVARLARREGMSPAASVACGALYLLYPALGYTNLFEFHPETLATAPLLFAFDALHAGRTRSLVLWTGLALLAKEDMALPVAGLALYALVTTRLSRRLQHAALLALMAGLSLVASLTILRSFNAGQAEYGKFYQAWGATPGETLQNLLGHPIRALGELIGTPGDPSDTRLKHELYLQLLLPVGFLALAAPAALIPALPPLAEHMLSSRPGDHALVFQYTAAITPFVIAAAVLGWARLSRLFGRRPRTQPSVRGKKAGTARDEDSARSHPRWIAPWALGCAVLSQVLFGPLIGTGWFQGMRATESNFPSPLDRALAPRRDRLCQQLPAEGGVVASFEFLSRLTRRRDVYSLHHVLAGTFTNSTRPFPVPTGVQALIADGGLAGTVYGNLGSAGRLRELCQINGLSPATADGDLILLTRAPRDTVELVTPAESPASASRTIRYDGVVAFEATEPPTVRSTAGGSVAVASDWRRLGAVDRLYAMSMVLIDSRGSEFPLTVRNLGTVFFPVHVWPLGQGVEDHVRVVLPEGLAPGRFTLAFRLYWHTEDERSGVAMPDDPAVTSRDGIVEIATIDVASSPTRPR